LRGSVAEGLPLFRRVNAAKPLILCGSEQVGSLTRVNHSVNFLRSLEGADCLPLIFFALSYACPSENPRQRLEEIPAGLVFTGRSYDGALFFN